jgi:hypothetical protein
MTVISTENNRYSQVVKDEYRPETAYCRDLVIVNDAAQTLVVGTLLGKVTATGFYKVVKQGAADGSQNATAVVLDTYVLPATTNTNVLCMVRGPSDVSNLVVDVSFTTAAQILAQITTPLLAAGIRVLNSL